MSRKKIPDTTQRIIYLRSGNMCCYPSCKEFIYNRSTKTYYGQICHIRAVSPNGPRYDKNFPEQEIDSEQNLLLMCANHHIEIDSDVSKFSIEVLTQYKSSHERKFERFGIDSETRSQIDIDKIDELTKMIDEMLKSESIEAKIPVLSLPKKKKYQKVTNYIERNLTSVVNEEGTLIESIPLIDILKKHNRVTTLSVAGTGKSIELKHLANYYSEIEGELYPVMVRLNLLSHTTLESYLKVEYPDFDKIPHENLLIILDALDEVHTDFIDKVANDIALLGRTFEKSKIVVSCRNNFYVTETSKYHAKIEGFKTYSLNPLNERDVKNYIIKRIGKNYVDFTDKLKKFGLFELMESPFYLVNLVEYYEKHKDIPKSKKEVFEYLIKERIEQDSAKYVSSGLNIRAFKKQIENKIEEIAITAQCLGRNYLLDQEEFQIIINDAKLLELINHTFLISNIGDKWMFDHNNFQEYLSARRLAKFDIDKIKGFISFPGNRKIKPYWVNTLSFLFSILDNKSKKFTALFDWITEVEEDILIRFEKDKLDIHTREEIFKRIYENYENKGIRIGNEKFSIDDLAKFVSDSSTILPYLIEKTKTGTDYVTLTEKIETFSYFDNVSTYKAQIGSLLLSKIITPDIKTETKYYCMRELGTLNITNDNITNEIITKNDFKHKYIRAGFYNYILNSDKIENYVDIYIQGINHCISASRRVAVMRDPNEDIDFDHESEEMEVYDEKYSLQKVFEKIQLEESIKMILDSLIEYNGYPEFYRVILKSTLAKAAVLLNEGHKDLLDSVVNIFLSLLNHFDNLGTEFQDFFNLTNTTKKVYEILYQKFTEDSTKQYQFSSGICLLINEEIFNDLCDKFKNKELTDSQVYSIRYALGSQRKQEYHDKFDKLISIADAKYKYVENTYEKQKSQRFEKDISLLLNKESYLQEVKNLYSELGVTSLKDETLAKYQNDNYNFLTNNIVLNSLRLFARETTNVELSTIIKFTENEHDWLWFKLKKLVSYDTSSSTFQFEKRVIDYFKEWVLENISTAEFSTAVERRGENNVHYRYKELFIVYFTEKYDIQLKAEDYLNFLFVDCDLVPYKRINEDDKREDRLISDFVTKKVGFKLTKQRILENLKDINIYKGIKNNYFQFCKQNNVVECVDFIYAELLSTYYSNYEKRPLIDQYLFLNGASALLENLLHIVDEDLKIILIEKLIKYKSSGIEDYCISQLKAEKDNDGQLTFIRFLLQINAPNSYKYLKAWVIKNKRIPDLPHYDLNETNIPDLIENYVDCLKNDYGNGNWHNNKAAFLNPIIDLSSKNETLYTQTRGKLILLAQTFENAKYLYYYIPKLDQQYYSNKSQAMTFDDARLLLTTNKSSKNVIINFYYRNKKVLGVILFLIGLVVGVIRLIKAITE